MIHEFLRYIASNPWVFDRVQYLFGYKKTSKGLAPYLAQTEGQTVLDVGAGTGNIVSLLPQHATYLWLDNDHQKLRGFKAKWPSGIAILGEATQICLRDKSVDYALCVALTHHLPDNDLINLFRELARIVKQKLILVDAVENKKSKIK